MSAAVQMTSVRAGYRDRTVLNDVDFSLEDGGMAAILGPNGAGKSTLLRTLTGWQKVESGTVRVFDRDPRALAPAQRARLLAVVPQELETPLSFTVGEMVAIGRGAAMSRWSGSSGEDLRAIERAMAYTDVFDLRDRLFNELSGGEKQRTSIAMALARDPRLILLDEPTSRLDINHRIEILQLVERLNRERGVAVLMTSHDLHLSAEFFPRMVLMNQGRIEIAGSPAEVMREETLSRVYGCSLRVQRDPAGAWLVAPARRPDHPAPSGVARRAHLVCGGGSGAEIMRRLRLAGWVLTCGVVNEGDSDARVAEALGIETALERPFSVIGDESFARAAALAAAADVLIVSDVPFGPGNARNLELAEAARQRGQPVWLNLQNLEGRDFTPDRRAHAMIRRLRDAGAREWQRTEELLQTAPDRPGAR